MRDKLRIMNKDKINGNLLELPSYKGEKKGKPNE